MYVKLAPLGLVCAISAAFVFAFTARMAVPPANSADATQTSQEQAIEQNAKSMLDQGRQIFRYSTFGDEAFWGDKLRLHEAIEGIALGGVGPGVSPKTALSVGLKVDMDKLPSALVDGIRAGKVDLGSPATTLALLRLDAVVGVKGLFADKPTALNRTYVCVLPLDRGQRFCAWDRSPPRRVAEPGLECRRNRGTCSGSFVADEIAPRRQAGAAQSSA